LCSNTFHIYIFFIQKRNSSMTLHLSIVADVFPHEAQAKHALEALRQAGFGYDQIGIAMQGHEGIDLQSDLQTLGVSHEQASYYAQEVKAGHTVVSVRPDGREQEAHKIMRRSGALTQAPTSVAPHPSDVDKQRATWEQAVASHQAYLATQRASNTHEDFHQPRSLKPRIERPAVTTPSVQTEERSLPPTEMIQQKPNISSLVHKEVVTQHQPSIASAVERVEEEVTEHASRNAPVVQQQRVPEPLLLAEEEHQETGISDDEDTLRRPRNQGPMSEETISAPQPLEKQTNRNMVKSRVLAGGLVLAVGVGVLLAFLQRAQIRLFLLSLMHRVNTQCSVMTRKNHRDHEID